MEGWRAGRVGPGERLAEGVILFLSALAGFWLAPRLEPVAFGVIRQAAAWVRPPGVGGALAGGPERPDLRRSFQRAARAVLDRAVWATALPAVAPPGAPERADREGLTPQVPAAPAPGPGTSGRGGAAALRPPQGDVRDARPPVSHPGVPAGRRARVQVAIYHTHTSEMYRRPDFRPEVAEAYHRFGDPDTGIVRVGRSLAEALNELGVRAVHVPTIHDVPDHGAAYARSEQTLRALLARHPDLLLLMDVHRDAPQEGSPLLALVDGEDVARIALVVGTGADGREGGPNLRLAWRLAEVADLRYPGLMRRVLAVRGRRYNQHLHPGALLVEIGSYRTQEAAAVRAARLFARVVAEVVAQVEADERVGAGWEGTGSDRGVRRAGYGI